MKNQIHLCSHSEGRRGNARSIIGRRGPWPVLLLVGCCAVLTGLVHPASAAVTEAWVHRYNNVVSNSTDQADKIVNDAAGDIIVTGSTDGGTTGRDMLTIKYSGVDGSVIWQKRDNYGFPKSIAVDGSGNVVVTGYSSGTNGLDYYTAKYAAADGSVLWQRRYNGPANDNDEAQAVAVDGSGNVVVTGYSSGTNGLDYYTAKYAAADGSVLWEKRYNGPANSDDFARALAVDGSGKVVVTGYSIGSERNFDFYTAKYAAADGTLLWEQRYNGPGNDEDQAGAIAVDGSGNVVVAGSSTGSEGSSDYYMIKYAAANGAVLWGQRYSGTGNGNDAQAVTLDATGNVVVTRSSSGRGSHADFYTAKYAAADGALLWEKGYNGPGNDYDQGQAIAVDSSGNVVVTGVSGWHNGFGTLLYSYTAKYAAADGALLWEQRSTVGSDSEVPRAVTVDGSGNVVVTGSSYTSESGYDYYTAKYAAADGALLWEKRYNGGLANNLDEARALAVDGSGNVVVTGFSARGGEMTGIDPHTINDYYTAKYAAADGALLWEKRHNGTVFYYGQTVAVAVDDRGNVVLMGSSQEGSYTAKYAAADGTLVWEKPSNSRGQAVTVDRSGNVVVTGFSSNRYYCTAKYAAADGALLWEKRYNGPDNDYDYTEAVTVDGSGNVVVTWSSATGSNLDYYTAKYAAADGALLWEQRYNGPANSYDAPSGVAVDSSGNVVVTGSSVGNQGNPDYYTAKYAAENGALLWEHRYDGPAGSDNRAEAVTVDSSGNVVVTGRSFGSGGTDYYTAKYAAENGALLWEQRYNGPGNMADYPNAVAVDRSGNVVVTGSSYNGDSSADYYTAKYAAADGALLWEQRYNGPANGSDFVGGYEHSGTHPKLSLALAPNGMIAVTGTSSGDYATVVYREVLLPVSIDLVPTGIRLRFTGVPGRIYTLERAPAVTGPWSLINTQAAPASGLLEYLDAPGLPQQAFYRSVQP